MEGVTLRDGLVIPETELSESFARAGGPGGQRVNTAATKAELRFDVAGSRALTEAQKQRVRQRLASRLTGDGVLVLSASEHRSQARNREAARARLARLLDEALRPPRPRRPTRRPRRADQRRLEAKKRRGERKRLRQRPIPP
jgi:ribosome-associated protein